MKKVDDKFRDKIAFRILELRTRKRWSAAHLAAMVGTSRNAVYAWENRVSIPRMDFAVKLAKAFGMTVEELVA